MFGTSDHTLFISPSKSPSIITTMFIKMIFAYLGDDISLFYTFFIHKREGFKNSRIFMEISIKGGGPRKTADFHKKAKMGRPTVMETSQKKCGFP